MGNKLKPKIMKTILKYKRKENTPIRVVVRPQLAESQWFYEDKRKMGFFSL